MPLFWAEDPVHCHVLEIWHWCATSNQSSCGVTGCYASHLSCVSVGVTGQQEQQANGCLVQSSSSQGAQQPHTPPSSAKSSSRFGPQQDQQQQQSRQATPPQHRQQQQQQQQGTPPLLHQQQQQISSQTMLLDLEQHPGIKALLALVQAEKFGSKEAAAVWADGQTVPTLLQVGGTCTHGIHPMLDTRFWVTLQSCAFVVLLLSQAGMGTGNRPEAPSSCGPCFQDAEATCSL